MIGLQLALDVWGYARAAIVGVHLTGSYDGYRAGWTPVKNEMGGRIRAIGGFAEQLFGRPDAAFVGAV